MALPLIEEVSNEDPRLKKLMRRHKAYAAAHTPSGSGHALEPGGPEAASLRYWLVLERGVAVGCVGLKLLEPGHGEVKGMHVIPEFRGTGAADRLIDSLESAAGAMGLQTLSLETGKSEGFAAARRFYSRHGFDPCEPFGVYVSDPFSFCMTKDL